MTNSDKPNTSVLWRLIAHIISDVLSHTMTTQPPDEDLQAKHHSQKTDQQTSQQSNLNPACLIICHQDYIDMAARYLMPIIKQQIQATCHRTPTLVFLTNSDFLSSPYQKQYNLGCYIDSCILKILCPDTIGNNNLNMTHSHNTPFSLTANISTRLRDLFAQHSLVLTDNSSNLLAFGFVKTAIADTDINSLVKQLQSLKDENATQAISNNGSDWIYHTIKDTLQIWQFNLYDYKPRPDWLNAKYWANPENFDKYRW